MFEPSRSFKSDIIESSLKDNRPNSENMCDVTSKDNLIKSSPDEPLRWDPVDSFSKSQSRSEENLCEQNLFFETCIDAIDKYLNMLANGIFTNNVGI